MSGRDSPGAVGRSLARREGPVGGRLDGRGMHTNRHIQLGDATRRRLSVALVAVALGGGLMVRSSSPAQAAGTSTTYAYTWPVKPFDRPHPVRGNFGDPRTIFAGPPTERTLLSGPGTFQFHDGVDISAPDGTAVYPVATGTVVSVTDQWVGVDSGNGRRFEYWHIARSVSVGQHVEADVTVLGHILRDCGHVHLTELDGNVPVNPLAPGHLGPYTDATVPVATSVRFRASITGHDLMPELLRGRLEIVAAVHDMPAVPVPSIWHDLPVTPALVEWRIQRPSGVKPVVPERVAYNVRNRLPSPGTFWNVYARGTHQNMSVFGKHYSYMQPGVYLFRLAPGGFDTRSLKDGVYELVVTAVDIRGNRSSYTQRFSVHNRAGVVGT